MTTEVSPISTAVSVPLVLSTYQGSGEYGERITEIATLAEPLSSIVEEVDFPYEAGDYDEWSFEIHPGSCVTTSAESLNDHVGNCYSVCFDPTTLFLPFNLQACLILGSAAMLIKNGTLSFNESNIENVKADNWLNIGHISTWDGAKIMQDVVECAVASCTQSNISTCSDKALGLDSIEVTADNLQAIYDGLGALCDNVGLRVNSDIAGPGVMTSYLLQICAAILFWLIIKVLTSWVRIMAWPFLACAAREPPPGFDPNLAYPPPYEKEQGRTKSALIRATSIQHRLSRTRLHAATVSTLIEFQEVQAFFIGAVQIATLATFKPSGSSQSDANFANSFGEAILDSQLVQALAINGVLPILLIQCILQQYGMRWWYTFTLLWVTIILALAVLIRKNLLVSSFDVLWQALSNSNPVDACGHMANPMVYCNTYGYFDGNYAEGGLGMVIIIYCSILLLTLDFFAPIAKNWRLARIISTRLTMGTLASPYSQVYSKMWNAGRYIVHVVKFLLEYGLAGTVVYYLMNLTATAFTMTNGTNTWGTWSFGQLIAVLVWVPTLFKFIYYNMV